MGGDEVPMVYPFLHKNGEQIRSYLIKNHIYVAQYWPNKLIRPLLGSFEDELTNDLVAIPIDHRYGKEEMLRIVDKLREIC
jgi:hypothetical protein